MRTVLEGLWRLAGPRSREDRYLCQPAAIHHQRDQEEGKERLRVHHNGVSVEFYAAIVKALPSCGIRDGKVLFRKDVTRALSELENALTRPDVPVVAGMGPFAWLETDFTGRSSLFMLLAAIPGVRHPDFEELMAEAPLPRDCADFNRCALHLVGVPQVKDFFEQIAVKGGPGWKRLLDRWGEADELLQRGNSGELQKMLDECRGAEVRTRAK